MTLVEPGPALAAPPFAPDLRAHGDRVAVVTAEEEITYTQLDERVEAVGERLGTNRRLVLIGADNGAVEPLAAYLAALRGGHPVLLVPGGDEGALRDAAAVYDPDVVIAPSGGWAVEERRRGSTHDLHVDLALLLSTSGSTGSTKLVRLSHRNLRANAESIVLYLGITPDDRAITTLPMQYCYGLSVVNSHLLGGAGLVLTNLSVVDTCFWNLFRAAGATSFAGVPHTFDLLDRIGFESMSLPALRCVTQAGGRLHPDAVRRYAALGERSGWKFFVMYGQTEATARMAYLPPDQAASYPHAIGVPIPGGAFRINAPDDDGVGELVYRGPNVMLGYASNAADLSLGATVDELHTGDVARVTGGGHYELVGRRSRFIKPCGVRIDLDRVERLTAEQGVSTLCTGDDDHLIVAVGRGAGATTVARLVGDLLGLPVTRIRVVEFDELPRLRTGKPDYVGIRAAAGAAPVVGRSQGGSGGAPADSGVAVRAAFSEILDADATDDDTFVGLGGDSLSYVEMSIRLEEILGSLPREWHTTPIGRLVPARLRRSRARQMETSVVVRAVAIVLIVGTHSKLWHLQGGAHALLGVAGYNFARFQLRADNKLASIAKLALPAMLWIGLVAAATEVIDWRHALLLHGQLGAGDAPRAWWFIEALVPILIVLALVFSSARLRRLERRWPFAFAVSVATAALAVRFDLFDLDVEAARHSRPHEVFWLFALGWAAARSTSSVHRLVVSALMVAGVAGFFGDFHREMVVIGGLLLITWLRIMPVPGPLRRIVGTVAGASMYIYLTHWQVYPTLLDRSGPALAFAGSVLVGVTVWLAAGRLVTLAEDGLAGAATRRRRSRQRRQDESPACAPLGMGAA